MVLINGGGGGGDTIPPSGGGGGSITSITSVDDSVTITNPDGPVTDLSVVPAVPVTSGSWVLPDDLALPGGTSQPSVEIGSFEAGTYLIWCDYAIDCGVGTALEGEPSLLNTTGGATFNGEAQVGSYVNTSVTGNEVVVGTISCEMVVASPSIVKLYFFGISGGPSTLLAEGPFGSVNVTRASWLKIA